MLNKLPWLADLSLLAQADGAEAVAEGLEEIERVAAAPAETVLEQATAFLTTQGIAFVLNLLAAAAIFLIGRWIAKLLMRLLGGLFKRSKMDPMLSAFLTNIAYALVFTMVILASLDRLGVNTTSFAAVLAAAGLAVGLALQGSLSNFASGVMIIFFKHFQIGNFVEAGGIKGIVKEIQIFHTVLQTPDNIRIIVPNSQITGGTITNFSVNLTRRIDLVVCCGYGDDLPAVKRFLEELVASDERILKEPATKIGVDALGDNSVNLALWTWVNASDFLAVRWDLIEKIKLGFDERGFNIPFPQRDVHLHQVPA